MTDLQPDTERQADQETTEALRELIARELTGARERTSLLTDCVDETDLIRQHSPLMSPLVWDLAHPATQEDLWLLREVGGRDPLHPEIDPLYDAFEHPRSERPTLPLLPPEQARAYGREVRGRVLDLLDRARFHDPGFGGSRAGPPAPPPPPRARPPPTRPGCRPRSSCPAARSPWALPPNRGRWTTSGPRTPWTSPRSSSTPRRSPAARTPRPHQTANTHTHTAGPPR